MGSTLGVIPIRRQNLNDGTYIHRDDVIAVLMGYAAQLDERAGVGAGEHLLGVDAVAAEFKHQIHWLLAREFVAMADFFKRLEGVG